MYTLILQGNMYHCLFLVPYQMGIAQHPGIYIITPAFQLANTLMDEQIAIPRLANFAIFIEGVSYKHNDNIM